MELINENTVLDFYLSELDKDNIDFLQNKEEQKSKIRKCIIDLKNAPHINDKIEVAKVLWKLLFESSMSYIDPDKRGYDNLFAYFDEYVNFEELIFASDSFYRDHTVHCLWVYFLGEYLSRSDNFKEIFKNFQVENRSLMHMKSIIEKSDLKTALKSFICIMSTVDTKKLNSASRCVAALTHDLGYPLKKVYKINKGIGKILPYFSVNNYSEFNFSYSSTQQSFIDNFISFLSRSFSFEANHKEEDLPMMSLIEKIFIVEKNEYTGDMSLKDINSEAVKNITDDEKKQLRKFLDFDPVIKNDMSAQMRYYKDFEEYQHGIMSAFLLMKTVSAFTNSKFVYADNTNVKLSEVDFKSVFIKADILKAISDHTSKGYQIKGIHHSSDLLILVDELEEFSRISRANMNREFVEEFCKSSIYMSDGVLNVDFIFDNKYIDNLNPEISFKGKCERFLTLFDIKNLDDNFKIRLNCIGKLPDNQNTYTLEIAHKFAKISINGIEKDIPSYLKSRQFYTREEYMNL